MYFLYSNFDYKGIILYCIVGIMCSIFISLSKKRELKTGKKNKIVALPYILCMIMLTIIAALRHIEKGIGGADANAYKIFFETCLNDYVAPYYKHYDILYRIFNYVIRYLTSNYNIYAIIFYGFISFCFIYFINEYLNPKDSKIPFILLFYAYLHGFNTYRTELAIAFILLSLVFYKKEKRLIAYILAFSTFFIHKASVLYALILLFLDFFKERKIKIKYCIFLIFISLIIGKFFQPYLMKLFAESTTNAYTSYIMLSLKRGFFENYWKICFEQLLLLFMMIVFSKQIIERIESEKKYQYERNIIWQICIYDFITIPITYILGIWRGYEYLYLPRLIMMGLIISIINKKCDRNTKFIVNIIAIFLILSWMIFRIYNIWESSGILPYVFDPFYRKF